MTIVSQESRDNNEVEIRINGRFDFSTHKDFRGAFESVDAKSVEFVINLQDTEYMDSSALGMLLLLRERAGGDKARIKLTNCNSQIRQILEVSHFDELFSIQ